MASTTPRARRAAPKAAPTTADDAPAPTSPGDEYLASLAEPESRRVASIKAAMMTPGLKTEDVEIEDVGTVTVRSLTEGEIKEARERTEEAEKKGKDHPGMFEHYLHAMAFVVPPMSVEDVHAFSKSRPAGDLVKVMKVIQKLSRLTTDAEKSDVE